ncbi:MAG TPA: methyltransferase [Chitinophagales bacterium]|nr:methyltransferase [Chitinophagales bacterium]
MSNNYFQFKQFRINQEKCAMKVCTDSCLFGAWITIEKNVKNVLDIGTGTGLLSLMIAQKHPAEITGIEIDENAYQQTILNFNNSVWKERLHVHLGDIKTFSLAQKFDFIICNPPFYANEQESKQKAEKIAKHSLYLTFTDLILSIKKLLHDNGKFAILLPYHRKNAFEELALQHLFHPESTVFIKQTQTHPFFRYLGLFSKQKIDEIKHEEITIKLTDKIYSYEAIALLKPYYLFM